VASFAVQHFHARCVGNVELKLVSELIAVPEGQCSCAFLIVTIGYECVANAKGGGQMAHQ